MSRRDRIENWVIGGLGAVLALWLRYHLLPFESGDFRDFLQPWTDFIRTNGGFRALGQNFSNYTPAYLYLLATITYLPAAIPTLTAIKLISLPFDCLAAFVVAKLVRLKYPGGSVPLFAGLTVLFAPTVVLNGAFWGQADIIYTTGLLACLYFLTTGRERAAFSAFGLALAFKLQALFLAPLLLIWLLRRWTACKFTLFVPAFYLLSVLPAWLLGRPLVELLFIYTSQADFYRDLTRSAPNLYQWLPNELYDLFYPAGLSWTLAGVLLFVAAIYKRRAALTAEMLVQLATLSVLMMPYLLPKMHERYFFAADVITIVYGFYFPRYFYIPISVGLISFFSYFPFLFGGALLPLPVLAIGMTLVLIAVAQHVASSLKSSQITATESPEM